MDKYLVSREEIDAMEGLAKTHFLNPNGRRTNKSLGDLTGLNAIGFHIIEVPPDAESTELHKHYHEEECVYVLSGTGEAQIDDDYFAIKAGDFLGYRAGGAAHLLRNNGNEPLRCIVVGQRLAHDVTDYPAKGKRLFRNAGLAWNITDIANIEEPNAGRKA